MALSEFIDSAGVNSQETAVGSTPAEFPLSRTAPAVSPSRTPSGPRPLSEGNQPAPTGFVRIVEKVLANPTLVIAGLAAVPVLLLFWGATRRRRKKRQQETQQEEE